MPIYEYECTACRLRFERQQSVHDEPVKICPDCGSSTKRVFHPVGIIFKGSGFYVTDNRKSSTASSSASTKSDGDSTANSNKDESKTSAVKSDSADKATTGSPAS